MELLFLGKGAAFNTKEFNNAAYFIEKNELFLIDCGEDIFKKIVNTNVLKNIKKINIMITHTHSDHIGSLGSLIMYCYHKLSIKSNILYANNDEHIDSIIDIINNYGCTSEMYEKVSETDFDYNFSSFNTIRFIKTTHSKKLNCYGIMFNTSDGLIYYSGDTNDIELISKILKEKELNKLYVDVTSDDYPGNVHININLLEDIVNKIDSNLKKKIYCMHFNDLECENIVKDLGYNIVKNC